jgi:predicted nucleic acid-binding protein
VLTLARSRGERMKALEFGKRVFDLRGVNVRYLQPSEIQGAWEIYRDNPDRWWSFTDCTSKVVMDKLHIRQALTLDRHFAELGATLLLK